MTIISAVVMVVTLNCAKEDSVIFPFLAFPIIAAGTIAHAIRNRVVFYAPWKSYKYTMFERWSTAIGMAVFLSWFVVSVLAKHGK